MNYDELDEMQKLAFDYGYQTEMEKLAGNKWDKVKGAANSVKDAFTGRQFREARGIIKRRQKDPNFNPNNLPKDELEAWNEIKSIRNKGLAKTLGAYAATGTAVGGGSYAYNKKKNKNK